MHTEHETCYHCGSATGKAGQGDGSISDALGNGPYCEKCWRELTDGINATLTARVAALTAEREKLRKMCDRLSALLSDTTASLCCLCKQVNPQHRDCECCEGHDEDVAACKEARALLDAPAQGKTGGG